MIIKAHAYARAGLIGNPSDGYYGKTISAIIKNFRAEVILFESPEIEIQPASHDRSVFADMKVLRRDVRLHGYYGGIRLIKAAIKKFSDHCEKSGTMIADRNFTIRYSTSIPRRVGLAGSSAIITATLRALMQFYEVDIDMPEQANLILGVEQDELGIPAGLQDRVVQVYGGAVYMDFSREHMEEHGHGMYEPIDPGLLPPLYVAYVDDLAEGSEVAHGDIRERFAMGDTQVRNAMARCAALAQQARDLIVEGKGGQIGPLFRENFRARLSICRVGDLSRRMVEVAEQAGTYAKFAGSGGAVVGLAPDESIMAGLEKSYREMGAQVIVPRME